MLPRPPRSTLFPYTTLFRSARQAAYRPQRLEARSVDCRRDVRRAGAQAAHRVPDHASRRRLRLTLELDQQQCFEPLGQAGGDRKSTRLNSSHTVISYAVFCLNAPPTTEIYTLSLHDALPICSPGGVPPTASRGSLGRLPSRRAPCWRAGRAPRPRPRLAPPPASHARTRSAAVLRAPRAGRGRSEEHTSELQSHSDLVCRLLLECSPDHRDLHSFPTRRSSDLLARRRTAHSVSRLARSTAVATCAVLARRPRTASPTTPRAAACVSRSNSISSSASSPSGRPGEIGRAHV